MKVLIKRLSQEAEFFLETIFPQCPIKTHWKRNKSGPIIYKIILISITCFCTWGEDVTNSLRVLKSIQNLLFFSSKFLLLSTGLWQRQLPTKIAARWRYRFPLRNLTPHYNSQFCVTFLFVLVSKPSDVLEYISINGA